MKKDTISKEIREGIINILKTSIETCTVPMPIDKQEDISLSSTLYVLEFLRKLFITMVVNPVNKATILNMKWQIDIEIDNLKKEDYVRAIK